MTIAFRKWAVLLIQVSLFSTNPSNLFAERLKASSFIHLLIISSLRNITPIHNLPFQLYNSEVIKKVSFFSGGKGAEEKNSKGYGIRNSLSPTEESVFKQFHNNHNSN